MTTPGYGPAPSGRAMYVWIGLPLPPVIIETPATIPPRVSVLNAFHIHWSPFQLQPILKSRSGFEEVLGERHTHDRPSLAAEVGRLAGRGECARDGRVPGGRPRSTREDPGGRRASAAGHVSVFRHCATPGTPRRNQRHQ